MPLITHIGWHNKWIIIFSFGASTRSQLELNIQLQPSKLPNYHYLDCKANQKKNKWTNIFRASQTNLHLVNTMLHCGSSSTAKAFWSFPPEIRNMIYTECVFFGDAIFIKSRPRYIRKLGKTPSARNQFSNILCVSRQWYAEITKILYSKNVWVVGNGGWGTSYHSFPTHLVGI